MNNKALFAKVIEYHRTYVYSEVEGVDADAQLYTNGFIERGDDELSYVFRNSDLERKQQIVGTFSQAHINTVADRILYRNWLDTLRGDKREIAQQAIQNAVTNTENPTVDYRGEKRYTIEDALNDIAQIRQDRELDSEQQAILIELEAYCKGVIGE